jgi:RHS repeat-associated protein
MTRDRLTQIIDSVAGTITRAYDGQDRLMSETTSEGSVSYTYDADGRRATMTVAGQPVVTNAYDDAHRLTSITQGTSVVGFTYDDANRRSTLTYPNGIVATYGYDAANQLTSLLYANGATTLGDLAYTYDLAGNRTAVTGSWARTSLPEALSAATYDAANRILTWAGQAYSYDANGNLASDGLTSYTWNARNQLTGLSGGSSASFEYDGLGRRRARTTIGATSFLYDGVNTAQELVGGSPTANLLTGSIDELFQRTDTRGATAALTDGLGSTVALVDGPGAVQTQYAYEPFGATTASGTASANPTQFTGRENDGLGLYEYRARYYEPSIGRFISEDPMGASAGTNFYSYVGNDPINFLDPWGLDKHAANNGRNCTPDPAGLGQYAAAIAEAVAMTGEFFSGLGPGNPTFGPESATSQVMAQSGPVQEVLDEYYKTGQPSGLYSFGATGYVAAGVNPVAQFVGSFRWSVTPTDGGITLSLTNTTSFKSLTYDNGPQWQRGRFPTPMGNTHQTYNIAARCR